MFAYCLNHECKVTSKSESLLDAKNTYDSNDEVSFYHSRLRRDWSCTLYIEDTSYTKMLGELSNEKKQIKMRPLNDILAQLSHDEYLYYHPLMEEADNFEDYKEAIANDKPELTFKIANFWSSSSYYNNRETLKFSEHIELVPMSFELERDPSVRLFAFDFTGEQDIATETDVIGPAFRDSIGRRRFKVDLKAYWKSSNQIGTVNEVPVVLVDPNVNVDDANSADKQSAPGEFIVVNDRSYDECALLCIDRGPDCGSFSYCYFDGQCTTSGLYDRKAILDVTTEDSQCVIVQRDFLAKFSRLDGLVSPTVDISTGKVKIKKTMAHDEHDCAHQCMLEQEFNCLSFDYCPDESTTLPLDVISEKLLNSNNNNACFLRATRKLYEQSASVITTQAETIAKMKRKSTATCWRHQRSYLADFNRLDHRSLNADNLDNLVLITGANVDECAQQCVEKHKDCNLFRFCFDVQSNPHQLCSVAATPFVRLPRSSLVYESNCYIYTKKKDITSNSMYIESKKDGDKQINEQVLVDDILEEAEKQQKTLSVQFMLCLTVITFVVSLTIGASIVWQRHYREQIEQRYRRLKARWFGTPR